MAHTLPREPAPALSIKLVDGDTWTLVEQAPSAFTMVVFYRHRHCSVCNGYLRELDKLYDAFKGVGVHPIAVSTDSQENAVATVAEWKLSKLPVGYDLPFEAAGDWGLFLSSGRHDTDPQVFTEPALFLIDTTGTMYFASIQSMPFGRASLSEVLNWIPKLIEKSIPARGELNAETVFSKL